LRRIARLVLGRSKRPVAAPPCGPVRVVIFDFDGTLGDTFQAGLEILNQLAGEYKFRPLAAEDIERARDMSTRELMQFLDVSTRKLPSISRQGVKRLRSRIHEIQPIGDVPDVVRELHRRGLRLGIITSNSEENVSIFLRNHDLDVFEFIRSSSRLLGKSREIKQAMKIQGFTAEEALFVGDETRDIEAARKARIRVAAATWGYNSARALEALAPDFVVTRPSGLLALVDSVMAGAGE